MKFSKKIIETICKHLKKGATITSTCEAVGISRETFYDWMKKKPDVSDAIKKAMAIPDKKVENALFKMATGTFEYEENHYESIIIDKIKPAILKKTIKKTLAPNITAQIFYLKNRKPEEWKDVKDIGITGELEHTVFIMPRPKKKKEDAK